jgi:hypothetical protein
MRAGTVDVVGRRNDDDRHAPAEIFEADRELPFPDNTCTDLVDIVKSEDIA